MIDELVVERGVNAFPEGAVIVGFHDLFETVGQCSISGEDAGTASRQEVAMDA